MLLLRAEYFKAASNGGKEMRLTYCVSLALACLPAVALSQTVNLRNVSAPYTQLEVGNTVEVKIAGAQ